MRSLRHLVLAFGLAALVAGGCDCAGDERGTGDAAAGDVGSTTCQFCGEELDQVRAVRCGESPSTITQCEFCCDSPELTMACTTACEASDCATACQAVEADADRHGLCTNACTMSRCPVACREGGVDLRCLTACEDFIDCASPGITCSEARSCLAVACGSGA